MASMISISFLLVAFCASLISGAPQRCDYSSCPALTCADPDYRTDPCCGDCSRSRCQLKGRVYHGAHFTEWYPSPCSRCICSPTGETTCTNVTCPESTRTCEKMGYQLERKEGECCPTCNYGIPSSSCGLVRTHNTTITAKRDDGEECITVVTLHSCDKSIATTATGNYLCMPTTGDRVINLEAHQDEKCRDVKRIVVKDTTACQIGLFPIFFS